FMNVDKKEKRDAKKEKGVKELNLLAQDIVVRKKGLCIINKSHWPIINSKVIGSFFVEKMVKDTPFRVEENRCVKCGICADICPVDNIKGGLGIEPEWLHNGLCTTCFACYHHCPHHAIEFGNRTKNKGQYYFHKK
ncbi:MAG TPA: EFR1 family ferrodoxin, partial [Xylanibacter oryzae]|nr:EFR1 family ferrodoxin [Xylanibacter oryzae]